MSAGAAIAALPRELDLPAALVDRRQWVAWRWEERAGKPTKVPINPATGQRAKANDPATWGTFAAACARAEADQLAGVGYIFAYDDPFTGVDVDDCRDPATGALDERGRRIVGALRTYAEISPSGRGVKLIARARLPLPPPEPGKPHTGKRSVEHQVEMYHTGRLFTLTGRRLPEASASVIEAQDAIDQLFADLFGPKPRPADRRATPATSATGVHSDEQVIERIRASRTGPRFDRLMAGDLGEASGNHSSADITLCNILAFWCDDAGQVERIWRQSRLADRDKFDRPDYRQRTIADALAYVTERYDWPEDRPVFALPPPNPHLGGSGPDAISRDLCPGQLAEAQARIAELEHRLAQQTATADLWKRRAERAEAEASEARETIVAMRGALANDQLGAERVAGVALAFEVASALNLKDSVDEATGEIVSRPIACRDEAGYVKVYLGHGSEGNNGRPTAGLAGAMGASANAASRQLRKLADDGVIEIDPARRKVRDADGNIRSETWVRFTRPAAAAAAEPPTVADLLAAVARTGRPEQAKRHGDPERFKSLPKQCPHCGGDEIRVVCGSCARDLTPNHQDGDSENVPPSTVVIRTLGHQDGDSGGPLTPLARMAMLRQAKPAARTVRMLDEPPVPGLCSVPGCTKSAEFDNLEDGYHCGPHALFKKACHTRPLATYPQALSVGD